MKYQILLLSIYFVSLSGCLFVSNKHQNNQTERAQILCVTSLDPKEGLWMIIISKISFSLNLEYPRNLLIDPHTLFSLIALQCIQRENIHN